ncbi:MAG: adenosylcobinamide-GDP ribazoletransferase [Lentisphaeria bacterium]|nr:adenosylcobinamide-GDP ribazoletransferase [Lentisphaeria bacterium]
MYHLLVALQFLTRFPVPHDLNPTVEDLSKCAKYFPVVGVILGFCSWAVCLGFYNLGVSREISIALAMLACLLMTGGFHEDGVADTFDGFGGAFSPDKKIAIMKDSRLGTYGALALFSVILIRYICLVEVSSIFVAFILSLMLGRLSSLIIIPYTPYSAEDETSKSKPIIEGLGKSGYKFPLLLCFAFTIYLIGLAQAGTLFIILAIICYTFRAFSIKQIKGITGDVLGAINVTCELTVLVYLSSLN